MLWFRNLQLYRLAPDHALSADSIADCLAKRPWMPCGAMDLSTQGWVPPAPHAPELYAYAQQDAVLVALKTEEKILPAIVVKQEAEYRIAQIEAEEHRKVGRKEAKELRERVADELLPKAFTRSRVQRAIIDLQAGLVIVDAAAASKAEQLLSALREVLGSLPARLIDTQTTPQTAMTLWLESADAGDFDLGQDTELRAPGDDGAIARFVRQPLDSDEVKQHLGAGKLPTRLALSWEDRIAFQLTERLELKRVTMLDVLHDEIKDADAADQAAIFDGGLALTVGELRKLVPTLIEALGGETAA
ncbi:recombination-associated protein RdgC [Chitiniphilus eburneus]|uniref:Recombination-associated protein RdgC n=1 Tax=Chitiniphilus eburneus TaxID=2571148 RepID=A0A4U0PBF3_9NEIS|nr:recombination-associated protein RdgC [Chitiniphilus eburneus]TJZ65013.1 recombination-associated protein RdgC [Chitiniphilus eburneus]